MKYSPCFPTASLSCLAASPVHRRAANHRVIRRGRKSEVWDRRKTWGEGVGQRQNLDPDPCCHLRVVLLPKCQLTSPSLSRPPCSAPIDAQRPAEFRVCYHHSGWDMGPSHRFKPADLHTCMCTLCTGSSKGREKSVTAFPRLCTVPLLTGISSREEER